MTSRTQGQVRIVGAGLIGTSVGLALSKLGVDVIIEDISPAVQSLANDYGAGRQPASSDAPNLIVVCVPPDVTAVVVEQELLKYPAAIVTDVASVKSAILEKLRANSADLTPDGWARARRCSIGSGRPLFRSSLGADTF